MKLSFPKQQKIALLLLLLGSGLCAFGQTSLSLASGSAAQGGSTSLNLTLNVASGTAPAAVQWQLTYPAGIASMSVTTGAALSSAGKAVSCNAVSGAVTCVASGNNAATIPNGVVAAVNVTLASTVSGSSIAIGVGGTGGSDATGGALAVNGTGNTVSVTGSGTTLPTVTGLTCSPNTVQTPGNSTCTLALSGAAPSGGMSVSVSDDDAALTIPASVTVASGASTATFTASASSCSYSQTANVTAVLNGSTVGTSLALMQATTTGGGTPAAGLVAAYSFNEGSGTTVADSSGNGNNGTVQGATWATGRYGTALNFNGSSSMVNIPDAASLHLTSGMTLEAWVNPASVGSNWTDVIYKANDNYFMEATSDQTVPAGGITVGTAGPLAYGASNLAASAWTHIALTYDGTAVRFFVNGAQVSSTAQTGSIASSTNPLQIGGDSLYGQYFSGLIDEVRIYNTALTAAQIQTDMNTALGSTATTAPPSLSGLACSPTTLASGASATCTVSLSKAAPTGGTTVNLSDNSTALTVPASVTVSAGSTSATFQATTGAVTASQTAIVTASLSLQTVTASLTISAPVSTAAVSGLACTATTLAAGAATACTVTLSQAAPTGGATVALANAVSGLTAPASVAVAAGSTSSTFNITAGAVTSNQTGTVTASFGGKSASVTITITASTTTAASVTKLACTATSLASNASSTCTVTLSKAAPASGSVVTLSDNSSILTVPASVTVASGATTANFTATSGTVSSNATVTITATLNGTATTSESLTAPLPPTTNPGLVASYSFNEGTGTTVADGSGHGNTGTISGATWTTGGKYGNALKFNGTSNLVSIANSASLNLTTGMTLEAWVNASTVNSKWRDVIYKGNDVYFMEATSDHSSYPAGGITLSGAAPVAYATKSLTASTWTHLALTFDGATLRMYVNGALVSSTAKSGSLTTSTNALSIGGDSLYGQNFAGLIDEVRVYNTALTATQIQSDMNAPLK